jgi:hypothetical protein
MGVDGSSLRVGPVVADHGLTHGAAPAFNLAANPRGHLRIEAGQLRAIRAVPFACGEADSNRRGKTIERHEHQDGGGGEE